MNYISTTDLRFKSSELIKTLKNGGSVSLVHRSKLVGTIQPATNPPKTITDVAAFRKVMNAIKPKKIIPYKDREVVYRAHLIEKYGQGLL